MKRTTRMPRMSRTVQILTAVEVFLCGTEEPTYHNIVRSYFGTEPKAALARQAMKEAQEAVQRMYGAAAESVRCKYVVRYDEGGFRSAKWQSEHGALTELDVSLLTALRAATTGCRIDFHEPDEQGIEKARVTGTSLDNAGVEREMVLGFRRDGVNYQFNLADLIALARRMLPPQAYADNR